MDLLTSLTLTYLTDKDLTASLMDPGDQVHAPDQSASFSLTLPILVTLPDRPPWISPTGD